MAHVDIPSFKERLLTELNELEAELGTIARHNPQNPSDWESAPTTAESVGADKNEMADKFEEIVENNAIMNELEVQYNDVRAALERIENGTYGICQVDGEPIDPRRLDAFPAARTCIAHANTDT